MHQCFGVFPDSQALHTVVCRNVAVPKRIAADLLRKTDLSFTGIVTGL